MVNYRRLKIPGGMFFFTVTLRNRHADYLIKYYDELKSAMCDVKFKRPFETKAFVVLPDHLHVIWLLPKDDEDYSTRWRLIKSKFTKSLLKAGVALTRNRHNEYNLWQRRYWEHQIRDEIDYENHVNYIHYNPVKHKYVIRVNDWRYSSFQYYVKAGIYPSDWSSDSGFENDMGLGEV